ncbi:DNA excision repair protein ERCC-6-like isoform X2 [Asterias amurensis]|uniref:DNA excision repair protein ERCC-6-like isoform X2 n=1 Tax=Asterias amurensis TaxID=7602 RepID=UPI003AB48005
MATPMSAAKNENGDQTQQSTAAASGLALPENEQETTDVLPPTTTSDIPQTDTSSSGVDPSTPSASACLKNLAGNIDQNGASTSNKDEASTSTGGVFSINRDLIPSVPNQMQATELQGLEGVSVFDQEEFEKGVLEQVDQAISARQQVVDRERAEKDLNAVLVDIRSCKKDLGHITKVMSNMNSKTIPLTFAQKEVQRNLISMRTKRDNKAKQLKTLRARQRSLLAKLSGSDVNLQVSDDEEGQDQNVQTYQQLLCRSPTSEGIPTQPAKETEQERLIRLGEMTPFGSMVQSKASTSKKPLHPQPMTDFEKFMTQKTQDDMTRRKKVTPRKPTPMKSKSEPIKIQSSQPTHKIAPVQQDVKQKQKELSKKLKQKSTKKPTKETKKKTTDSSDDETYFVYKPVRSETSASFPKSRKRPKKTRDLKPHWGSDAELSDWDNDGNNSEQSDEDYTPGFNDLSDEDEECFTPKKKSKKRGRKESISTEDFEDGTIACLDDLKKSYGVKVQRSKSGHRKFKCKDDATQDLYFRRLKENRRSELVKKQRMIERGEVDSDSEPEDMQFEGGLIIPGKIWCNLYKYQKVGVKWLWELHQQQAGGIIGDEMGLGKTIQMIAFLAGLRGSKLRNPGSRYIGLGPVLIVCPATVMHQWVKEFHKWYPEMRVAILHDSGSHTGSKRALIHDIALCHGTLVTSYSAVRIQEKLLLKHTWHYIVLDEGHKIRNPDAAVTQACKQFRTCHRLILSGSPMQNNLRELWSLIDFVFPGKLGTLPVFMEKFSVPITIGGYSNATQVQVQTAYKCASVLRDTINPYLLRRLKADVKQNLNLPSKSEQVLFCRLSEEQIQIYKDYLNSKECQLILNREYQVFAGLITLRKICNHPDLVSGGPRIIKGDTSLEAVQAANDPAMQYGYWQRSGKMIVINSLLKLWSKQNHRVLLFSQSKQMLDIIEDFVKKTYTYMRMDGTTPISSRQPLIQQYNNDPSIFVFLLTTRVGGLGVNLTGANRVVIFDPDWNPSTDTQARERAWRIGQTRQVTIYRLITAGAIEEKIYHRQIFKQFLTNRVLKDPRQRRFFKSNDLFELFTLTSDSNKHGTETSAIFAGVGSDVKVPTTAHRPARKKSIERRDKTELQGRKERNGVRRMEVHDSEMETGEVKSEIQNGISQEDVPGCSRSVENGVDSEVRITSRSNGRKSLDVEMGDQAGTSKGEKSNAERKRRKKKKDARLDGHRIAHLAKHTAYQPKSEHGEPKDEQTDAQKDDYVLSKLFKKSGVHSALQHDNIMEAASPDYLLVEGEAERVARDAVKALKDSRRHCHRATSGVPTWTGSGASGGTTTPPKKPRFGQKSNNKVAGLLGGSKLLQGKIKKQKPISVPKPTHFSGKELIETAASQNSTKTTALPSSGSLLAQIRKRNNVSATDTDNQTSVVLPQHDLLVDIRDFVSFQAETNGQATTNEILHKFRGKLPSNDSALFKSMLTEICVFQRVNGGEGLWKLKEDFR